MARRKEEWKVIDGYPNYLVSNFGEVKTRKHDKKKLTPNDNGILVTRLQNDCGSKVIGVHRLVFEAFARKLERSEMVTHKDGDKHNNKIGNLCATSRSGIREEDLLFIKENSKKLGGTISSAELARKYGVSPVAILKIINRIETR